MPEVEFGLKVSYFTLVVLSSLVGAVGNTMVVLAVLYFKVRQTCRYGLSLLHFFTILRNYQNKYSYFSPK